VRQRTEQPSDSRHALDAAVRSAGCDRPLFRSVFLAGFECSSQCLQDGRRLDLVASTRHDEFASFDYARLAEFGISAAREGVNWVRAEARLGQYEFGHVLRLLHAAKAHGVRVIWDLAHFGWPDHVDPFRTRFPEHFARYARAFASFLASTADEAPILVPINEISFLAWAGGDVGCMNPFELARGVELKAQLVRATIEAMEAVWDVLPQARFLQPEPLIQIVPAPEHPKTWRRVEADTLLQYQAWDMLSGRVWPTLGGHPRYLDLLGVNFYPDNQFMLDGTTIFRGDPRYRPFSELLLEAWRRYRRPMLVSETGSEGESRAPWLRYVSEECRTAMKAGCELHGITLYPILNHPGWLDERHCENGLWDYADDAGQRQLYQPLASELREQAAALQAERTAMLARRSTARARPLEHPEALP
jgi:hypothetical protein